MCYYLESFTAFNGLRTKQRAVLYRSTYRCDCCSGGQTLFGERSPYDIFPRHARKHHHRVHVYSRDHNKVVTKSVLRLRCFPLCASLQLYIQQRPTRLLPRRHPLPAPCDVQGGVIVTILHRDAAIWYIIIVVWINDMLHSSRYLLNSCWLVSSAHGAMYCSLRWAGTTLYPKLLCIISSTLIHQQRVSSTLLIHQQRAGTKHRIAFHVSFFLGSSAASSQPIESQSYTPEHVKFEWSIAAYRGPRLGNYIYGERTKAGQGLTCHAEKNVGGLRKNDAAPVTSYRQHEDGLWMKKIRNISQRGQLYKSITALAKYISMFYGSFLS